MTKRLAAFIDGQPRTQEGAEAFDSSNPATGEHLCAVEVSSVSLLEEALASARAGQAAWGALTGHERGAVLRRAATLVEERQEEIARVIVADNGKPIEEARGEADAVAFELRHFADVAAMIRGESYGLSQARFAYTRREPLGVCAAIGAWNYPFAISAELAGPMLCCGNAVILKPSELTPWAGSLLAEILTEAGAPPGTLNVVHGDERVGRWLSSAPGIAKVGLVGEAPTGVKVMQQAAPTLKRLSLELGGKSPLIVFADCRYEDAVTGALKANFMTQGQICSNGTRVLVEASLHDRFVADLTARAEAIRVGDPMDDRTQSGPLISAEHLERVLRYVRLAREAGATVHVGGEQVTVEGHGKGHFMRPTILTGVADDHPAACEEIFGPVMIVSPFATEEEAVARANDTPYGLAAGLFTQDVDRAHRVAARLEAGTCWINDYGEGSIHVPFSGHKMSGYGLEGSADAIIEGNTLSKTIIVSSGPVSGPY